MIAQINIPVPVEVTYDQTGLFVGAQLIDYTDSALPIKVGPVKPMVIGNGFTYGTTVTPTYSAPYVVNKAVYTDGTYATVDENYAQGSDRWQALDLALITGGGGGSSEDVVGYLDTVTDMVGIVDTTEIVGILEESA